MQQSFDVRRAFRKYHRWLAAIVLLPLGLTVITGILITVAGEWSVPLGISPRLLTQIHTGEIFHLEGIYPILDGVGVIGLLVTGATMLRRANRKPQQPASPTNS